MQADEELRSRVWWCCYILDKVLAEETGRPVLLHARRSTTPLPASAEADEYELWPPPSASAFLPSRSLNRERYEDGTKSDRYGSATVFEPAQGRLLSAFQTTCKLGVIVEEILDLDEEGPRYERSAGTGKDEEEEFQKKSMESALRKKDALAKALEDWYADLPDQLNVDVSIPRPAPTHLIVNLAVSIAYRIETLLILSLNIAAVAYHEVVSLCCNPATLALHFPEARSEPDDWGEPDGTLWGMSSALCQCGGIDRRAGAGTGEEQAVGTDQ